MKTLLVAVSILGNVALLATCFVLYAQIKDNHRAETAAREAATSTRSIAAGPTDGVVKAPIPQGQAGWTADGIAGTIEELRRMGAPKRTLVAVALSALHERYDPQINAARFPDGTPQWKLRYGVQPGKEQMAKIQALRKAFDEELQKVVGPEYESMRSVMANDVNLSALSDDKRVKVSQINSDYQQARQAAGLPPISGYDLRGQAQWAKDMKSVLTPKEFEAYDAFNSPMALQLQQRLATADLTDEQYKSLYAGVATARDEFVAKHENAGNLLSAEYHLAQADAMRKVVGDEVFANFAIAEDSTFKQVAQIAKAAGESSTDVVKRYYEFLTINAELERLQSSKVPKLEIDARIAPLAEKTYKSMTAGLPDDARRRFELTTFGAFLMQRRNGR